MNHVQSFTVITVSFAVSLIVTCSRLADLDLSRPSASFTTKTNFCVPRRIASYYSSASWLIFFVVVVEVLTFCVLFCKVLGAICQRIVAINNKDTNELIYFENQFIMHYASTNVELNY